MPNEPIYLRGRTWWCYVTNPSGGRRLRVSTGTPDRKAAIAKWRELEQLAVAGPDQATNETTLADALDRRIDWLKSPKPNDPRPRRAAGTIEMLTKKSRHLNRLLGADTLLSRITPRSVREYVMTRETEGAKATTIHKELSTLYPALRLARKDGYRAPDPRDLKPEDFSIDYVPRTRWLTEREVDAVLGELPPKRAAVVAFIVATGATYPSEVVGVTKAHVDTKNWIVHLPGTKRASRNRRVPIPRHGRDLLKRAVQDASGRDGKLFEPWGNVRRDLLAVCAKLSTCAVCRNLEQPKDGCKACASLKFEPFSPVDLRRTFSKWLRNAGVHPQLIAPLMGHTTSRMVEKVYGRIDPAELAKLVDAQLGATTTKLSRRTA